MRQTSQTDSKPKSPLAAALAALLLAVPAPPAAADDRSLVKASESEPYVMILLDITGSMNRLPTGSQPYATLAQDDPDSKMYQAKEAIYRVLEEVDDVHFGFAVFPNQNNLRIPQKLCNRDFNNANTADDGTCINELDSNLSDNGCSGWEPNSGDDDVWNGMNLKHPTVANPNDSYPATMHYGDVIPMDWDSPNDRAVGWSSDNRRLIQRRLAPNLNLDGDGDGVPAWNDPNDPEATPDFGVNRYFRSFRNSDNVYPLLNDAAKPLVARGSTPLARSLRDFNAHFAQWETLAEANDLKFGCKQVYVIMITDGLDTCESSSGTPSARETQPPIAAGEVFDGGDGPKVWVVGYSISGTGEDVINNMADQGGSNACPVVQGCTEGDAGCCDSGDPDHAFFPETQDQLVEALTQILNEIRGEARSFAAAAVPQAQADVSDKIFLASFLPFKGLPLWPGSLDVYLRPLPLTDVTVTLPDGTTEQRKVPDRDRVCPGNADDAGCRLWDAGEELVDHQAAPTSQLDSRLYNLGQGDTERRVFYSVDGAAVPASRKPFVPGTLSDADAQDLMELMGCGTLGSPFDSCDPTDSDNLDVLHSVARWVHETKQYEEPEQPGVFVDYLLGEIFHSDPVVVGAPENFRYYAADLFADRASRSLFGAGLATACSSEGGFTEDNPGFVCFFERNKLRRKIVLVGSNDGQLHAFDAGVFDGDFDPDTGIVTGRFTNGTGREVFSYIPRAVMPTLVEQSQGAIELYGVDGRVQVGDVFIDVNGGAVNPDDREWRTVVVGGLREGGVGYYALDITQPDLIPGEIDEGNIPDPAGSTLNNGVGYVPSCTDGGSGCGPLPYPAVLWEFYDRCTDLLGADVACDEDLNFLPDLADGWSRPAVGIVEVCAVGGTDCGPGGDDVEQRFVAVVGGGFDPEFPLDAGNHVFMIDVQTGKPIYKRAVEGAVPSEPAAVDTDQDGVLDTIYFGTTAGLMYKVSLRGRPPLVDIDPGVDEDLRVISVDWDPFKVFDVGGGRPIFYPPSVIFVTDKGRFALAFGTGYREDLWRRVNQTARFFVVLDEIVDDSVDPVVVRPWARGDALGATPVLPLDASDLQSVDPESTSSLGINVLTTPQGSLLPGWWMELQNEERVIASPFALSGLLVFLTFQPDEVITGGGRTCANAGQGRSFTVLSVNGDPVLQNAQRYTIIDDLPTSPYTEAGVTKNPAPQGGNVEPGIPPELEPVMDALKKLFPKECKFANYTINVKTRRADTGIEFIAPVPICFVQKNWKGL